MIYFVTNLTLPETDAYKVISPRESLDLLEPIYEVGLDTETKGLDPYTKELLLLQLGNEDFQVVIDCTTISPEIYREYLESDRLFLGHNIKFDIKFLMHQGIILKKVYDSYIAEKLLWNGYPNGMHGMSLQSVLLSYLNIYLDKTVRGKIIWSKTITDDIVKYAAGDVEHLIPLRKKQLEALEEKGLLRAADMENAFVPVCAYFEYCGVKIDIPKWKSKMEQDNKRLEDARQRLDNWVIENKPSSKYVSTDNQGNLFTGFDTAPKCTINWGSSKQVIPLFKELGFNLLVKDKKTGEMKYSVEGKVIKSQESISTISKPYLEYKGCEKITSTYGQNIIDEINPVTGRLHTNYNQLGTDTNRLSSGGKDKENHIDYINMQNIPADELTRSCFISEEGNTWISCDYSSQESRLMAELSNDEAMIDLFNNGCGDVHSLTAKMSYPEIIGDCPVEDIKSKFHHYRQEAKGIELKKNNSSYVNKWL